MKIQAYAEIDIGRPIKIEDRELTRLADYIQLLCETRLGGEQLSGPSLYRLGQIWDMVEHCDQDGGLIDLNAEDIALFKERLPKAFHNGLIVKRVYDVLEGTHSPIK